MGASAIKQTFTSTATRNGIVLFRMHIIYQEKKHSLVQFLGCTCKRLTWVVQNGEHLEKKPEMTL